MPSFTYKSAIRAKVGRGGHVDILLKGGKIAITFLNGDSTVRDLGMLHYLCHGNFTSHMRKQL